MRTLFRINKDERILAFVGMVVFSLLNVLLIYNHFDRFCKFAKGGFWTIYNNQLHLSGYDPYPYMSLSKWDVYYDMYRHPIFTLLLYPFSELNGWLLSEFHMNFAMFIMAIFSVLAATYSLLFAYRIFRIVLDVNRFDSRLLAVMLFSFAAVMTSSMSPDHFIFSMFLLLLTLLVVGTHFKEHKSPKWYTLAILYFVTAGVTLSNGVKTLIAAWFSYGKATFRLKHVFLILLIPTLSLIALSYWQEQEFFIPRHIRGEQIAAEKAQKDSTFVLHNKEVASKMAKIQGKPLDDGKFLKWSDMTTSRTDALVENLFGESIILHQDHLLGDIFLGRPVIVRYKWVWNYVVEFFIVILFFAGLIVSCRRKFMLLCLSWFAYDMLLHFGLGFGLNEVYIMGCHWLFIIPVSYAYLLKTVPSCYQKVLRMSFMFLTVYLFSYNGYLIVRYLI
jgi:hypothetical protein